MIRLAGLAILAAAVLVHPSPVAAAGPRNPYAGFNLSGINWGSQQWERDQRAGRVVWPYYNVPERSGSRTTIAPAGNPRSPRAARRWRR